MNPRIKRCIQQSLPAVLVLALMGLTACRTDRVSVNPKDLDTPQHEYRLDELALLQMGADDIQELERSKQYGKIYDQFGSDAFKKGVSRRRFLIMANCVESFLGDLEEFDHNDVGFRRQTVKGPKGQSHSLDVLNRKVQRALGSIEEQLVFVQDGLSFKLNGLYWISKDKQFLQCIAESPQIEASTAPKPEKPPENAESEKTAASETEQPKQEANSAPASETAPLPDEEPSGEKPESAPKTAAPVQVMKPDEIKKEPLQARPAGAGAVIDQRPAPPKKDKKKSGGEGDAKGQSKASDSDAKKKRIEPDEPTEMVPLPTTGGIDD